MHIGPGIISMANTGLDTNNSQFLIYNAKTEWLDGTNVVFGQVVQGFEVMKAVKKSFQKCLRNGLCLPPCMGFLN
ncbi:hypothetical protein Dsin_008410 [Dipteronia sinensis]|uniref:Peptidyl-prolyl cis-trans isomerase n=1 Tax=Dipteronia sinensis TaxID=43782 RepID=A0AAE0APK8_9ROSI|nr:hypothetical protein Dsin_008410 [Dipteronia sinensis]